MFHKMVEERMRARQVVSVDTTPPAEAQRERDSTQMLDSVSASVGRQLEELRREVDQPAALDPERDFGGLGTRSDLMRHVGGRLLYDMSLPIVLFPLYLGDIVVTPPYAHEWALGSGFSFGATADGTLQTVDTQGVSVAGVNVYLTSNADHAMDAAITPLGTFKWNWNSFENLPTLQSRGGLGNNVVHAGTEISRRESALWTQYGATQFSGQGGEGNLPHVTSVSAGPFGPIEIFPTYITMQPGEQYLFGLWCWQVAQYPDNAGWIAFMMAKMTAVSIRLSERPHIG
jgi:hypothetical protein